jgi:hypothetical protein
VSNTFRAPADKVACESYITVGSQRYPDFSVTGTKEMYWRLLRALGTLNSLPHTTNVLLDDYNGDSHVVAFDVEKVPTVYSTGLSLAGGQNLIMHFKTYTGVESAYISLHHEIIVQIGASGVTVLN